MAKQKAKKILSQAQIKALLKFKIDWIKDPVPPFKKFLDKPTLKQIELAKVGFGKQIDAIVKGAMGPR